ncbi:hypothetical protein EJ08DRAFT_571405, partial [Tothia fuscella]
SVEDITALPFSRELRTSPHLRPATQETADIPYDWNLQSRSHHSLPTVRERTGKLQRNPSRNKRAAYDSPLAKRKPSKKRKDEHIREEEIRSMTAPGNIPRKPGGVDNGLLSRDTRNMRSGLNRSLERPMSKVSLPHEDSIHSAMSTPTDGRNYKLGIRDIVAPRPTMRYTVSNPYSIYAQPSRGESRATTKSAKKSFTAQGIDSISERARVDSLADEFDSAELKELMDRDKRRKETKRKNDIEKVQRKLQKRVDKQRAKEFQREPISPMEDVRETGPAIPAPISPIASNTPSIARENIPRMPVIGSHGDEDDRQTVETPFEELDRMDMDRPESANSATSYSHGDVLPNSPLCPGDRTKASKVLGENVAHGDYSKVSKVLGENLHRPLSLATPPPEIRRESVKQERKRSGMWSAIFRRDRRKSFVDVGASPSEVSFSNTSRESMSRHHPPTHLHQAISDTSRSQSGGPIRTQSKFREHLPELPISPPDSRVQSPEATTAGAQAIATRRGIVPASIKTDIVSRRVSSPYENLTSHGRTDSPASGGRLSNLMSQSLASVDSEASWLSGKPHRMSSTARTHNSTGTASVSQVANDFSASYEELGMPDDEYFRRLKTPHGEAQTSIARRISNKESRSAIAAGRERSESADARRSDSTRRRKVEGETVVHTGASRHPTVVHRDARVKSSEGLLNQYNEADVKAENAYITPRESPRRETFEEGEISGEDTFLSHAKSINLGKDHARKISTGSAKLLDITNR